MYLQTCILRMERKEIVREKERVEKINSTLREHSLGSARIQKLQQNRKESIEKIETLELHSQKLWDEIQTQLSADDIHQDDITAFQLRFYDLKDWSYIAVNLNVSEDNAKKRVERIAKSIVMVPDDKGVI